MTIDLKLALLWASRRGVGLTLLPNPRVCVLSLSLEHPSGVGYSARVAVGDSAFEASWRTLVGTRATLIWRGDIHYLYPRDSGA